MERFYLLIIYGATEIEKIGPFYSTDARDRRALELHKRWTVWTRSSDWT
jgi:hypothetical protein